MLNIWKNCIFLNHKGLSSSSLSLETVFFLLGLKISKFCLLHREAALGLNSREVLFVQCLSERLGGALYCSIWASLVVVSGLRHKILLKRIQLLHLLLNLSREIRDRLLFFFLFFWYFPFISRMYITDLDYIHFLTLFSHAPSSELLLLTILPSTFMSF